MGPFALSELSRVIDTALVARSTMARGSSEGGASGSSEGGASGTEPRLYGKRGSGHVFTIALGLAGWFVVLALPALGVLQEEPAGALPVVMFVTVIVAARALAFRLLEGSVLSLDSAYYVAAALCVGTVEAGRLVALALTVDAFA